MRWFVTAALLFCSQAALAASPTITVPVGQIVVPNTATSISGINIAEVGAGALTQFTTTITSANGIITANGTGVSGSGTNTLTVRGTALQSATAFGTLQIAYTTSLLLLDDIVTITCVDASNNAAAPASFAVRVDGNKYLVFSTLAAAQARSQQQCQAVHCDGVNTIYWWHVSPTATGGAVQIRPGDPCFDAALATIGNCAALAVAFPSATLTTAEQSTLVTAPNVGLPAPNAIGGASAVP